MATRVFTLRDTKTGVGIFSTYSQKKVYEEAFRLYETNEQFEIIESWLIDEWVDLSEWPECLDGDGR